jgi:hypothetical protein
MNFCFVRHRGCQAPASRPIPTHPLANIPWDGACGLLADPALVGNSGWPLSPRIFNKNPPSNPPQNSSFWNTSQHIATIE